MDPQNPLPKQLRLAEEAIKMVAQGSRVCAAISGAGGLGKTYLAENTLKRFNIPYEIQKGTGKGLMAQAYDFRESGVIVIDDADNLITGGGLQQANFMKQLLNPVRERTITNDTKEARKNQMREEPDPTILPPRFTTRCGVIWLTNINTRDDSEISKKMAPHLDALIDRGLVPVRLSDDHRWKLDYVLHLATEGGLLRNFAAPHNSGKRKMSYAAMNEVLAYFVSNAWRLPTISVRRLEDIANLRMSTTLWAEIMDDQLSPTPRYSDPLPEIPVLAPPVRVAA